MEVIRFSVRKLQFMKQNGRYFRAFGAIRVIIRLFRWKLFSIPPKNHHLWFEKNSKIFAPSVQFPIKNSTVWNKIIPFTAQKSLFLEQNSKIFTPSTRFPHFQLEIWPFIGRNRLVTAIKSQSFINSQHFCTPGRLHFGGVPSTMRSSSYPRW